MESLPEHGMKENINLGCLVFTNLQDSRIERILNE